MGRGYRRRIGKATGAAPAIAPTEPAAGGDRVARPPVRCDDSPDAAVRAGTQRPGPVGAGRDPCSAAAPALDPDQTGMPLHAVRHRSRQLEKTFTGKHEVRALDGVSFNVDEGTVFGLLGPNGSGKTTAVRILTTILKADGGSARVLGHDVAKKASLVRSLIGLAGQYAAVDENLTGRENLEMVGNLNHLRRSSVGRPGHGAARRSSIWPTPATGPLKTYSGGMRRRLDLAAALVARPTVLFLDEPTTGLDPQSRNDLWEVIEQLVGGGTTVLLTTQYLEEADRLADTLVGPRPRAGHRRGHADAS